MQTAFCGIVDAHAKQKTRKQNASHKKQSFGSETSERQQQSSLCQAKNRSKRGFRTMAAQSLVSVRFEKTETPARFEPTLRIKKPLIKV